jgi:hypothetical protein
MAIDVRRFRAGDRPALQRLDGRLEAAGVPHRVGCEEPPSNGEPCLDREPIIERLYVAADGDEIRGGVWLKEQMFWAEGAPLRVGWPKYLVAETPARGAAALVPATLLFRLLRQQPHMLALGMGGHSGPFAKLLAAARWPGSSVPFFVSFVRPSRVLRRLSYARTTRTRRALADGLALSGLAWLANTARAVGRSVVRPAPRGYEASVVATFDGWADELWVRCRDAHGLVAVRDRRALNALYPAGFNCLARLRVRRDGRDVGWICPRAIDAAGTPFERQFRDLRLGILTDGLANPADVAGVLDAGIRYLVDAGVDLVLTYQTHPAWCAAARRTGLFQAPSASAFYRSPAMEVLIAKASASHRHYHLTWSDGDGPERIA